MTTESLLTLLLLAAAAPTQPTCPADMRLVEGVHHEEVQRVCLDYRKTRCWSFLPGLMLLEPRRTTVRTCMDRYEWPNTKGENPEVMMRFVEAEKACVSKGKRLCSEFEWEVACEGAERRPWPYGWQQREGVCNSDKMYRFYDEPKLNSSNAAIRDREVRRLWQGAPSGSFPRCESPSGIMDMVGNVEEWVTTSRPQWPHRSSLKGGYWSKKHTGCRGTNESHGPQFRYYEIGFRCCAEPR